MRRRGASSAGTELQHSLERSIRQPRAHALGETDDVRVVADAPAGGEFHRVDGADMRGLGRQLVEQAR